MREQHGVNLHVSDHRRSSAQLAYADDEYTAGRLLTALSDLVQHAEDFPEPADISVPSPRELRLEQAEPPRDAFFGRTEQIPLANAAGRVGAEMPTPYPPGIPAVVPGERLTSAVLEYLRSGVQAKMVVPDAVDAELETVRVPA